LLRWLIRHGIEPERAERGVGLALIRNKVVRHSEAGTTYLQRPVDWRAAC
jgi:hypothetical protein